MRSRSSAFCCNRPTRPPIGVRAELVPRLPALKVGSPRTANHGSSALDVAEACHRLPRALREGRQQAARTRVRSASAPVRRQFPDHRFRSEDHARPSPSPPPQCLICARWTTRLADLSDAAWRRKSEATAGLDAWCLRLVIDGGDAPGRLKPWLADRCRTATHERQPWTGRFAARMDGASPPRVAPSRGSAVCAAIFLCNLTPSRCRSPL